MAIKVLVPDLGGDSGVEVIEVLVKVGDTVNVEDALIVLESDKASMDVPSSDAGVVKSIEVKVGDKVSEGDLIITLEGQASASEESPAQKKEAPAKAQSASASPVLAKEVPVAFSGEVYAGPAIRRLARELGVDLAKVKGSGQKGRVLKQDLQNFVKNALSSGGGASGGMGLPEMPAIDFNKWGETESKPLNRIKQLTAKNLTRNWLLAPQVTQFDESDITDMEAFRQQQKTVAAEQGIRLTPLVFLMKAVVKALKAFPQFNASLDSTGENLILKKYFHIGVAVETPEGLVVPVIRDVDRKSLFDLAKELGEVSVKARDGKLKGADMQGGCFTISSLGGISGTGFTPIVNLPEVAILGVSKSQMKPQYDGNEFVPRLMLPLCLTYDHRVIDGADGARFTKFLSEVLSDIRQLLL